MLSARHMTEKESGSTVQCIKEPFNIKHMKLEEKWSLSSTALILGSKFSVSSAWSLYQYDVSLILEIRRKVTPLTGNMHHF